jgi:L-threonylcarbamoyladenylate synthase
MLLVRIIHNCTATKLKKAATALVNGKLVVFPTETVYGLGADAANIDAVNRIYHTKGRPAEHPVIIHFSTIDKLDVWAKNIPDYALKLASSFWPGPMTLILPRTNLAKDFITGGQQSVGVRVPNNVIALALLTEFEAQGGIGIAAPSANRFGKVSPTTLIHVVSELSNYLGEDDLILDGGQSDIGVESTIINCTQSTPAILRPGAITDFMIQKVLDRPLEARNDSYSNSLRVPGLLESHYSPKARVILSGNPLPGDGFIALDSFKTPPGVVRLASPKNANEYAKMLYQALHLADQKELEKVFAIPPEGEDISVAIRDRLTKAAFKD